MIEQSGNRGISLKRMIPFLVIVAAATGPVHYKTPFEVFNCKLHSCVIVDLVLEAFINSPKQHPKPDAPLLGQLLGTLGINLLDGPK